MPEVGTLTEIAKFLQEYGGWAVSVLLMVAIVYLHRFTSNLLEQRNAQLVHLLEECKSVVAENKVFMDNVEGELETVSKILVENKSILDRLKLLLEDFRR
jgi:hypothetical protein